MSKSKRKRLKRGVTTNVPERSAPASGERVIPGAAIASHERRPRLRRSSGNAYVSFVEHAVHGMFRSDRHDRFLTVNTALAEMLGYDSEDELLAIPHMRELLTDPEDQNRLTERFRQTGRVKGLELVWRRKDGSPVTVHLSGRPVTDPQGLFDGFEVIVEDVHERRMLEAQLQQAQKMEAIGHLTGGIAHDFNNLLTVILATSDILAAEIAPEQEDMLADLTNIRNAAQRGAEMARKLLGFSRRSQVVLKPLKLSEVVPGALNMLRPILPESIDLQLQRDEEVGTIRADAGAVEQILMNLITNARDAMPKGGALRVETRRTWLDEEHCRTHGWGDVGEYAALIVSDTGSGMDTETRRRIFEPFFTTKAEGAGTGLGMSMVFGLVKQHGGFVDLYSEPAQGSSVKIYFPVIPDEVAGAVGSRVLEAPRGTETILLVEDEETIRLSAIRILHGLGYRVLVAADGDEALTWIRQRDVLIDLVVTDMGLPKLSGTDLYKAAQEAGVRVPFLFMSAYPARELLATSPLDPRLPFLYKPWTMVEFAIRVREVLDQSVARRVLHGRTVLLVDDDAQTRAVLLARLKEVGCVVREAEEAKAALRLFREARPDVVLTDLVLPGQPGAALIKAVRREAPAQPVIAISGSIVGDRNVRLEEAQRLGATRALPKPFTTSQLMEALLAALTERTEGG